MAKSGAGMAGDSQRRPSRRADVRPSSELLHELVSLRMVVLFGLMRRSGVLAQRRLFDLSALEWRVMVHVAAYGPMSLNELAEWLVQDRGQVSRAVKGMVGRGLLSRQPKPGGPEIEIDLAPQGEALHKRMNEWAVARDDALTKDIPREEVPRIRDLLNLMIERAYVLLDEERALETGQTARVK
jgi:DNA-binding MarR family transcriptional regulator